MTAPAIVAALAGIAALAGCRNDPPALASCADSLSGVWRGDQPTPSGELHRFHAIDRGDTVTLYPMFDDSVTTTDEPGVVVSPGSFQLTRRGRTLVGTRRHRASRDGIVCVIAHQAAIRGCRGHQLTLVWTPTTHVDWTRCAALSAPAPVSVQLTRTPAGFAP